MSKQLSNVGAPGEELYGFSQAVRSGDTVFVSGQTASGPGSGTGSGSGSTAAGDLADQMRRAYAKVADVLAPFDAGLDHVVDEVLYVTDIDAAVRVAPAVRREAYGGRPAVASTLVEVRRLAAPDLLVEVKCTARLDP
jgi:2-iminobutanoate/2-iminopropanoate deaminase